MEFEDTEIKVSDIDLNSKNHYRLNVDVKGPYAGDNAPNAFNYSVERYVSPTDVLHALMN